MDNLIKMAVDIFHTQKSDHGGSPLRVRPFHCTWTFTMYIFIDSLIYFYSITLI